MYRYNLDVREGRDPFEREADFHIRFERVHPFEDGNGRTGRILLERGLMLSGLEPPVITVNQRAEYLELLSAGDTAALANMLEKLCEVERERIEAFRAAAQGRTIQ